jgi:hypothetical protein
VLCSLVTVADVSVSLIMSSAERACTACIHFPFVPSLEHRAPFGVYVITYRHTVGLLWTSDQPVAEAPTYRLQHNI